MFDDEKLRVTLNIAGEQVKTVINRSDEEELRMLEKEVTSLFNRWRVADPSRTKSQVLAMVAFQYAKLYYDELTAGRSREASLRDFVEKYEERLDAFVDIPHQSGYHGTASVESLPVGGNLTRPLQI